MTHIYTPRFTRTYACISDVGQQMRLARTQPHGAQAPTGAGKTTVVPLAIHDTGAVEAPFPDVKARLPPILGTPRNPRGKLLPVPDPGPKQEIHACRGAFWCCSRDASRAWRSRGGSLYTCSHVHIGTYDDMHSSVHRSNCLCASWAIACMVCTTLPVFVIARS